MAEINEWYQYDKPLSKNGNEFYADGFFVQYGECERDQVKIFRGLIIHLKTMKQYRFSFNSEWCPEENKKWLLDVTISHHIDMIREAHNNAIGNVNAAYRHLIDVMGA